MSTATLQVTLDGDLKRDAENVFASAGLDAATAVRMFLKKVVSRQAIPSDIVAEEPDPTDPFYSPANQKRLMESIHQFKTGEHRERQLIEA